ncbi:MAG: acyl-CoA thioesterase [Thermoleophilia bacterium]|nr:acyl-CoA thioesterase [Thermoleophilia bacterium]
MIKIKIRPYHIDLLGHVNNARYLEFLEEGRWTYWEKRDGFRVFEECGWVFMVVKIDINYRTGVVAHEVLEVSTALAGLGNRSGTLRQEIRAKAEGKLVADADVVFVMVDRATGKALPMSVVAPVLLENGAGFAA